MIRSSFQEWMKLAPHIREKTMPILPAALQRAQPQLTGTLDLSHASWSSAQLQFFAKTFPNITGLKLANCELNNDKLGMLAAFAHLTSLDIRGNAVMNANGKIDSTSAITERGLFLLTQRRQLTKVVLSPSQSLHSEVGGGLLYDLVRITSENRVVQQILQSAMTYHQKHLHPYEAHICQRVKELHLFDMKCTLEGISQLGDFCPAVQVLHFKKCTMPHLFFSNLSRTAVGKKLKELALSECKINELDFHNLLSFKRLERLVLDPDLILNGYLKIKEHVESHSRPSSYQQHLPSRFGMPPLEEEPQKGPPGGPEMDTSPKQKQSPRMQSPKWQPPKNQSPRKHAPRMHAPKMQPPPSPPASPQPLSPVGVIPESEKSIIDVVRAKVKPEQKKNFEALLTKYNKQREIVAAEKKRKPNGPFTHSLLESCSSEEALQLFRAAAPKPGESSKQAANKEYKKLLLAIHPDKWSGAKEKDIQTFLNGFSPFVKYYYDITQK